jgi:hypothetical protein
VEWWVGLDQASQLFWSIAIVSSVLFFILLVLSRFGLEGEVENGRNEPRANRLAEPRAVLFAFALFGWSAILSAQFTDQLRWMLLVGIIAGMTGAILPALLSPLFRRVEFRASSALNSTGRVLKSIPPHRGGIGKVHINLRSAPYEMEAVTVGDELPVGAAIRVVEVLDERVLVVEAADGRRQGKTSGYPQARRGEQQSGRKG